MFRKKESKDFICKYRNFFVTLRAEWYSSEKFRKQTKTIVSHKKENKPT